MCVLYVQNSAVAGALRAVGVLARSLGNSSAGDSFDAAAETLRANMLRLLTNTSDGGWLWAIDTHSLTPTPAITNATVNIGFAGINWGFTLLSDGVVGEYTPVAQTSWRAGLAASQATYKRLLERPLRQSLWEQYGIFAQFDVLNQFDPQHGGLPGHGTSAYGQDYATHYMLLNDDLVGAGRAIRFLANATAHGGQTLKSTYFFERMQAPFLTPEMAKGVPFMPMAQWGCGELNLVGVEAPTKTARLLLGLDDTNLTLTRLLPRLPPGWTRATATNWPVITAHGLLRVDLLVTADPATGGCKSVRVDVLDGGQIAALQIRLGGQYRLYTNVSHLQTPEYF